MIEAPFLPEISDLGQRHPVTAGLDATHEPLEGSDQPWGRWMRQIEVTAQSGQTVMTGNGGAPLLMLDRVGQGRVALLASDQPWLWDRGYEGGGPQLEMLRRLAHWMMGEPDLEEEALVAEADGQTIRVTRRTLADGVGTLTSTSPGRNRDRDRAGGNRARPLYRRDRGDRSRGFTGWPRASWRP